MKIRLVEVALVTSVALLSWFFMFSLECYFGNGKDTGSRLNDKVPPFPDDKADNVFWFLQVA